MSPPEPRPSASSRRVGVVAVVIISVLWGTTGTAATFAPDAGPLAIGPAVLGLGGLLQALIALPALHRARGLLRSRARTVALGAGLGLLAAATYATYSWASHRLMASGAPREAAMGAVFGIGGLLLMPVLALTGAPLLADPRATAVAAYMALVPMFVGYVLFGVGLARVPASTATTLTLIEPAVAALLAVAVLGERLTALSWAGLALLAVVLVVLVTGPANGDGPTP